MLPKLLIAALALSLAAAQAQAWSGPKGNDTGGIIPWSPEVQFTYEGLAAAHCAWYSKIAFITSVHPWYGDYITFVCAFPPGHDPVKARYYWYWR